MSEAEAEKLAAEGKPFYFLYATIHSTEVSNGQVLVIDHWYKTKGTGFNHVYPDLYHNYVGHDDNRDWFMFTQKDTRMNIEYVQNRYKPIITHDMHQQGGGGARIFVPPFTEPFDPNMHPLLRMQQGTVGQAMAHALMSEGKKGVAWEDEYDMWSPARQYMVYHGQPRILTEIATATSPIRRTAPTAVCSAGRLRLRILRFRTTGTPGHSGSRFSRRGEQGRRTGGTGNGQVRRLHRDARPAVRDQSGYSAQCLA